MQEGETSVTQSTEQNQRLRTSLLFLFSMFDMTEFITCRGDDSSTSQQIFWCDMKDSFSLWLKAVNVSTFLSSFPGNKTMEGVVTSVNTGDQTVCQQTFQSHRKKSVRTEMFELWCINQLRGAEQFPVSCFLFPVVQSPRRRTSRPTSLLTPQSPAPTRSPRWQWRGWRARRWRADWSKRWVMSHQSEWCHSWDVLFIIIYLYVLYV